MYLLDAPRCASCLFLNVVAPTSSTNNTSADDKLYPVVVYLHAGEFDYGAASDRESDWPFAPDVVYVAPNSRLGLLGYDDVRWPQPP